MISTARPHGPQAFNEFLTALHVRYGGSTWALADKSGASGAGAVADIVGRVPGTPSATGLTFGSTGPAIAGEIARACAFAAASSGSVSLGDNFSFERTQAFTASAWINTSTTGTIKVILGRTRSDAMNRGWLLDIAAANTLRFTLRNTAVGSVIARVGSTGTVTDGKWHHVAATSDGSGSTAGMFLYIDGVADSASVTNNLGTNTIITTAAAHIGSIEGAANFFNGTMLYPMVVPVALTAADIRTLYTLGKAGQ